MRFALHHPPMRSVSTATCLATLAVFLVGCQGQTSIETYRVPKQHVVDRLNHVEGAGAKLAQTPAGPEQTLAAIILRDTQGWFFKLSGPPAEVGQQKSDFLTFVKSIKFETSGNPTWTLPDGWEEQPGVGMRHVTIEVPSAGKPLELSVITLPRGDTDEAEYLLANINRWRGQVSQPPIQLNELPQESQEIELAEGKATVVDIQGTSTGGGMRAPFAGGGPMSAAGGETKAAALPAPVEFTAPEQWAATPAGGMRKAAFEVKQGDQRVEITVIDLEPAAGELLPNVNRWRGQVKLPDIDQEQLEKELKPIQVDGHDGHYVELKGPGEDAESQTILGAIVVTPQKAWFFKLLGPTPLAEQEKARFEAFIKSVKFK